MKEGIISYRPIPPSYGDESGSPLKCIACGHRETKVVDSRHLPNGDIRRTRCCRKCTARFKTVESIDSTRPLNTAGKLQSKPQHVTDCWLCDGKGRWPA